MKRLLVILALGVFLASCGDGRLSPQGGTVTGATTGGGLTVTSGRLGLLTTCTTGYTLVWDGDSWECASPGNITAVTAGTGLTGGGTSGAVTLAIDTSTIQARVTGTCAVGSSIASVAQDGTVACETDDDTTYTASGGLTMAGTNITIATGGVSNAKFRNSAALSVIGRSANTVGGPADIAATSDGDVLRVSGTSLGFGTIATAGITDNAITMAKLADATGASLLGATAAGDPSYLTGTQATTMLDVATATAKGLVPATGTPSGKYLKDDLTWAAVVDTNTLGPDGDKGDITVGGSGTTLTIDSGAVTLAKMANMATSSFIARTAGGTGVPQVISAASATTMLSTFTTAAKGLVPAPVTSSGLCLKDDATWGSCGGGGGITNTAPSNTLMKSDGTNAIASSATDDGSTFTVGEAFTTTGITTIGSTNTQQHVVNGQIAMTSAVANTNVLGVTRTTVNAGNNGTAMLSLFANGTNNSTAAAITNYGVNSDVRNTRASGANNVTNMAGRFNAQSAQVNVALQTDAGDVILNNTSGTTTINGNTTIGTSPGGSAVAHTIYGHTSISSTGNGFNALSVTRTTASATQANQNAVSITNTGGYDTTAGAISTAALNITATQSRSAGTNNLTNYGIDITASGAQSNIALRTQAGDVQLNATSGTTTLCAFCARATTFASTGTTIQSGNAGSPITIGAASTGGITIGAAANATTVGGSLAVNGDPTLGSTTANTTTLNGLLTANSTTGTSGDLLTVVSGLPKWQSPATSGIATGSGTANRITKWNNTTGQLVDTGISDAGSTVSLISGKAFAMTAARLTIANGQSNAGSFNTTFTQTAQTTSGFAVVDLSDTASFNTTSAPITHYGYGGACANTVSSGANTLTSICARFTNTSTSGSNLSAIALQTDAGDVVLNATSGTTTIKGATTINNTLQVDGTTTLGTLFAGAAVFFDEVSLNANVELNSTIHFNGTSGTEGSTLQVNGGLPKWVSPGATTGWAGTHVEWSEEFMRRPSTTEASGLLMGGMWQVTSLSNCTSSHATSITGPSASLWTPNATGGSCKLDVGTDTTNRNINFVSGFTWTADLAVNTSALSDGTAGKSAVMLYGMTDSTGGVDITNGCYFAQDDRNSMTGAVGAANAGKWECWCASGGSRTKYPMDGTTVSDGSFTTVNTPIATATNTYNHLRLVVTGTTLAEFFVDGTKRCQITTNIPVATLGAYWYAVQNSATGANVTFILEWARVMLDMATARGNN